MPAAFYPDVSCRFDTKQVDYSSLTLPPFGMLMPERHGFKVDGAWAGGGTDQVNGTSVPQHLTIDCRNSNTPPEYKASKEIDFVDEFVSGGNDEFLAYIADGTNTTSGNTGGVVESLILIIIALMGKRWIMK